MVDASLVIAVLALLTGFLAGAAFAFVGVPIPAPPNVAGVLGIVGIYLGFKLVEYVGWGYDLLGTLGL
ncbi:XapX domain-containing protein [Natronomonas sp. CBA1123]|jgi:XapX domain-containing protein|uniref:XapX domain-containing protein n=1 Tax=Natronomonas sp. CBA1123 TaxID=2668070 RepID=UPI0012EAEAD8|nr:XapX domain-containing protein [Natronomonas sp. CBA1123]MUV87142.1 XapX domain-containing protein [Natronomonas sp. CBA1123]